MLGKCCHFKYSDWKRPPGVVAIQVSKSLKVREQVMKLLGRDYSRQREQ